MWSDKKFDEIAKQLVQEQSKHSKAWIKQETQYGEAFYDFDGTTGFDLWGRLEVHDKARIKQIVGGRKK